MPEPNLLHRLVALAVAHPDKLAVVEPSGARITFGELEARTAAIAGGLRARGLEPGARVLVLAPMGIPLYLALLALFRAGLTAVLVDPSAPRPLLRATLGRMGLAGFFGSPKAHLLRLILPELRGLRLYLATGFTPLPHRRLAPLEGAPLAPVDPVAPALVTFTTGTSGRPRAMARSHVFLDAQREALTISMGIGPDDVDLATLPVFLLNSLSAGATCVLADTDLSRVGQVDPVRIAQQLQAWQVTTTSGSPAFFAPLARHLRAQGATLPALRRIFVGGGRVPSRLLEDLVAVAPQARVQIHYGSTEADPIATCPAAEFLALGGDAAGRGACVGRPVPGIHLALWAPGTAEPVEENEPGEVVLSGAHVNETYLEDPAADARFKVESGGCIWHRTGDMARRDLEGRLWLLGRAGECIGGHWPLVAEAVAESLPWVRRAGLSAQDGEPILAVELEGEPVGWEATLRERTGVARALRVAAVPVDRRHNAKIDRIALAGVLTG